VDVRESLVELRSPLFVFGLNAKDVLRAEYLENRSTGRKITFANTSEFRLAVAGDNGEPQPVELHPSALPAKVGEGVGEARFVLSASSPGLSATVDYEFDGGSPVIRKTVEILNESEKTVLLLDVYLGEYAPDISIGGRECGFPVYVADEAFMTLAHPAGWAKAEDDRIALVQYPGVKLEPGDTFRCMEVIYGVARNQGARKEFLSHLRSRMRRVARGHDKPYAIFEPFGGMPGGDFNQTEAYILGNLAKVAEGKRDYHFDLYSLDFWVDYHGDLIQFDPVRFPNGIEKINEELRRLGPSPGLWIDSSWEEWSVGGNPAVEPTLTHDPNLPEPEGRKYLCRATEPIKSMYVKAFRHHIRENGVRLLKFDNFSSTCDNPNHDHLPGIYSTEAIMNAQIEFLREMDEENPDVFLMLYWGHLSPWWLVHADTLFDSGVGIEAAHPSDFPAPYARDSVTQKLDQAQEYAQDIPALGKDSLGVWLSDWGWNSSIGKERWAEAFVMDICRGSLLAQPWSDTDWLSPPERKQIGEFIALLKARPECFGNPCPILGSPGKEGTYGYCCSNGRRAFLAINNYTWKDSAIPLSLDSEWGLRDGDSWDIYRWYPQPARLKASENPFKLLLRPFEVALLEVVPAGEAPSLDRVFDTKEVPAGFPEASGSLAVTVESPLSEDPETTPFTVTGQAPTTQSGGTLVITVQRFQDSTLQPIKHIATVLTAQGKLAGRAASLAPIFGELTYPSSWHGWRISVEPSPEPKSFELSIHAEASSDLDHTFNAYFLPHSDY
jgi:hypothetical protein